MKALIFHGPRDIRYETFPDPELTNPRHVIIEVSHCSICGSDLHLYHGDRIGPFDYSQPQPKFCVGHETIGRVMEVGSEVKTIQKGQRLLVAGGAGCGTCQYCLVGDIRRCTGEAPKLAYGISPLMNGGQADYLEVFAADATSVPIPDGVTDAQAILMTDAMATGHYGLLSSGFQAGETVCVIGQGPVGLMAAEIATAKGASHVFTIDPVEARRNLSASFGAEPLAPEQARERILEDTDGQGVDRVVEAVGHVQTITEAVRLTRPGGGVGIVGLVQEGDWGPVPILRRAQGKSVSISAGVANVVDSWPDLLSLVKNGKVKGDGIFTHDFSLEAGADAYALFDQRADGVVKVMIRP